MNRQHRLNRSADCPSISRRRTRSPTHELESLLSMLVSWEHSPYLVALDDPFAVVIGIAHQLLRIWIDDEVEDFQNQKTDQRRRGSVTFHDRHLLVPITNRDIR